MFDSDKVTVWIGARVTDRMIPRPASHFDIQGKRGLKEGPAGARHLFGTAALLNLLIFSVRPVSLI